MGPIHCVFDACFLSFKQSLIHRPKYNLEFRQKVVKCDSCLYKASNYKPNSTPEDIIFSFSFTGHANIIPFMRTLRNSGSKASVIIIVDNNALNKMSNFTKDYFLNCGGTFVNIGNVGENSREYYTLLSYSIIREFLIENSHRVNRVIKVDLFDTLFQGDPFYSDFSNTHMMIYDEGMHTKGCWINKMWLDHISPGMSSHLSDDFYHACSGIFGGTTEIFVGFISSILSHSKLNNDWTDQGALNILWLWGIFHSNGVILPKNRFENTFVRHLVRLRTKEDEKLGTYKSQHNSSRLVMILHHTHYDKAAMDNLLKFCPPPEGNVDPYTNLKGLPPL